MLHPASLLEDNLDRVIDSVVRNVTAGRGAVPDPDAVDCTIPIADPSEAEATLADLCGHVAYVIKSMDGLPHPLATYRAPEAPVTAPTLNLIR